jgi:hypothetical protein
MPVESGGRDSSSHFCRKLPAQQAYGLGAFQWTLLESTGKSISTRDNFHRISLDYNGGNWPSVPKLFVI